ncbi:archaellin/type IV pilin N-terminal domain-containing protein [[Eubacterium] cellulosolvens]
MKKLFRKDDEAVSPVIAVILMVAITVVLAGVLYVWVSGFGTTGGGGTVKITATKTEKTTAYVVSIASVSGGDLNLDDAKIEMADDEGTRVYSIQTGQANPTSVTKGQSTIYPIPSGTTAVQDAVNSGNVGSTSNLTDYEDAYIAFVDQNSDGKINADDTIWIYKDWTRDSTQDVFSRYTFKILDADGEMVLKKQL